MASALITEQVADFRAALPEGGVLIGLDPGTRSIGIAFCDAGWWIATPAQTLPRGRFTADRARLATWIVARDARGIVLGLPRNMDGSEGPRAQASRAFARNLASLGLPILLWDERWSTQSATRDLIAQDMSRAKRAARIDAVAAAVILQGAIDALSRDPMA